MKIASEALTLVGSREPALLPEQPLLGAAQLGDVVEQDEPPDRPSLPVDEFGHAHLADARPLVRLKYDLRGMLGRGGHRRDELDPRGGYSEQPTGSRIGVDGAARRVEHEHRIGHALDNRLPCHGDEVEQAEAEQRDDVHKCHEVEADDPQHDVWHIHDVEHADWIDHAHRDLADQDERDRGAVRRRADE